MIIPIYKPVGWTSFDVVKKIRSISREKKVGHAGTLDPFAEGVLIVGLGTSTKQLSHYTSQEKEYDATLKLGVETDTLDVDGEIIRKMPIPELSAELIQKVFTQFIGIINQVPPMYSAKKINGKRLYTLARKKIDVKRESIKVHINSLRLLSFSSDTIHFSVVCSKGTYIRQLAADIAKSLGTVGYLTSLIRTRVGHFTVSDCTKIEDFEKKWMSIAV